MEKIKINNVFCNNKKDFKNIFFLKKEITLILNIYSKNVSKGIWKDYAIDYNNKSAIFSIFRNSFESSVLTIEKKKIFGEFNFFIKKNNKVLYSSKNITKVLDQVNKIPKLIAF